MLRIELVLVSMEKNEVKNKPEEERWMMKNLQ
jgi:hypothetical protein